MNEIEALTAYDGMNGEGKRKRVLTALRERLAQPEQESVKFNCTVVDDAHPEGVPLSQWGQQQKQKPFCYHDGRNIVGKEFADHSDVFPLYTGQQPEQEPVAWGVFDGPNLHDMFFTKEDAQDMARLKGDGSVVLPLYTAPPQRTWVGLTDDEVNELVARFQRYAYVLLREVEAKLKEKNHG